MSRPTISYPTPVNQTGPSNYQQVQQLPPSGQIDTTHLPRRSSLQVRQAAMQARAGPNTLDSSITRLLVVTKQLLQGLEQWAQNRLTEDNVSDIYVRLGDGFETCVAAFHRAGIQTRELDQIPLDLRSCLEQCLAEDPSQESLNQYLPDIRQIIYNLLDGLKRKQAQYKRNLQNAQAQAELAPPIQQQQAPPHHILTPIHDDQPEVPPHRPFQIGASPSMDDKLSVRSGISSSSGVSGTDRDRERDRGREADRDRDRERERDRERGASPALLAGDPTLPIPAKLPSSSALAERERERQQRQPSGPSRPAPPDAFRPPRRIASESNSTPTSQAATKGSPAPGSTVTAMPDSAPVPPPSRGIQLKDDGPVRTPPVGESGTILNPTTLSASVSSRNNKPTPPRPERFSRDRDSYAAGRVSRFSADSDITNGSPVKSPPARSPPTHIQTLAETDEPALSTGASTSFSAFSDAPALPKLELPSTSLLLDDADISGKGGSAGADSGDQAGAGTFGGLAPAMPDIPPESHRTLATLRGFDPLERRASKRYSSFTFNKMLPSSPNSKRDKVTGGPSPQRPAIRRQDSQLEKVPPMPSLPEQMLRPSDAMPPSARIARSGSPASEGEGERAGSASARSDGSSSSLSILRTPEARPADGEEAGLATELTPRAPAVTTSIEERTPEPTPAPEPTSLQLYLQLGRQVKKCRLDLPITFEGLRLLFMEKFEYDPGLDDFPDVYLRDPISGVGYELEDVEDVRDGAVLSLNIEPLDQVKQHFDHTFASLMAEVKEMKKALDHSRRMSISTATSLLAVSQSQSSAALRNLPPPSAFTSPNAKPPSRLPSPAPRLDGIATNGTVPLTAARREDLEKQHDELSSLRRDLAVIRQIHSDFLSETKDSFGKLRAQNTTMKEVIKTKIGGSRALLDHSKAKLEGQSNDSIQATDEILELIDLARDDAQKRFATPSNAQMKKIRADLARATELANSFTADVGASEVTWRATWAQELSRVKEEQALLAHHRGLGADLKKDLNDAAEMWANVEAFVAQRKEQLGAGAGAGAGGGGSGSGGIAGGAGGSIGGRTPTSFGRTFRPASPDESAGGGVPNLLMEIRTKEGDPHSRLRAIEAQQRQREKERQVKLEEKDEFAGELEGFVMGRKLRKTGGTEEVERARNRRHELTLKKMMSGAGAGAGAGEMSPQVTGAGAGAARAGAGVGSGSPGTAGPGATAGTGTPGAKTGTALSPQFTGTSTRITPQMTGSSTLSTPASVSGSGSGGSAGTASKRASREG